MSGAGWLPAPVEELFGTGATAEESYEVLTVDVPPDTWISALLTARDELGCTYFDWLSAVDEPGTGFSVSAHVVALAPVRRLLVRTTVAHEAPVLPTAVDVYAGAAWHERETHEMFGVSFRDHPGLDHLLLPETFEGHPLRKDFVLAARVAKAWPGAKEPGEPAAGAAHGGPKRRQMLPPGVPDPNEWGPQKGQLPPAPSRPARGAARAAGDRPVRRTRTAAEGSTGQTETAPPATRPRRMRSAGEGSASQTARGDETVTGPTAAPGSAAAAEAGTAPERAATPPGATPPKAEPPAENTREDGDRRPASGGPAPQRAGAAGVRRARSASEGSASRRGQEAAPKPSTEPRGSDAPWHHARPAFDEPEPKPGPAPEDDGPDATEPPTTPETPTTPDEPEGGPR
ncbi:NADH-quinone oxidoreductase subunit C [Streptomyces sp. CB01373]|uniref:NADH-quinone oxidoreductase subunit C n=1 Tax=Streptomyces sp. CB01373 TaxID=2020325 RepID=UPI000C275FDC|nr:NADH-quinone oxidoreductase subunit C [Streptomyces sp. CB01373]PJM94135.1 dehydrogenase [Streptomyces sp. CB01373]